MSFPIADVEVLVADAEKIALDAADFWTHLQPVVSWFVSGGGLFAAAPGTEPPPPCPCPDVIAELKKRIKAAKEGKMMAGSGWKDLIMQLIAYIISKLIPTPVPTPAA